MSEKSKGKQDEQLGGWLLFSHTYKYQTNIKCFDFSNSFLRRMM